MKKLLLYISLSLFAGFSYSQNSTDALRYSRMNYQGSARFNAMGGSFGALGGEMSSILINPASIGVYRNSEFTFSTALLTTDQNTSFDGRSFNDNAVNFNIPNIGFVSNYKGDANGWKNYSFGIGHSRINNFRADYVFRGNNTESSSFLDPYVQQLNQLFPTA